jgi:TatD DNase family protein
VALELAGHLDRVFASVGIHPHKAKSATPETLSRMEALASRPEVVAYGEIGLDFFRDWAPRDLQIAAFKEQLALGKKAEKPVVIHLRSAYRLGLDMIEEAAPFPRGGVIHCFSGNAEDARRALDLGFCISIPGTITYKKNHDLRKIVETLPADRLLLETDCPFLPPEPFRGRDNEPALMVHTAERVAQVRHVPLRELARTTTENAHRLFKLPAMDGQ